MKSLELRDNGPPTIRTLIACSDVLPDDDNWLDVVVTEVGRAWDRFDGAAAGVLGFSRGFSIITLVVNPAIPGVDVAGRVPLTVGFPSDMSSSTNS